MTDKIPGFTSSLLVAEMRERNSTITKAEAEIAVGRVFDALKTIVERKEDVRVVGFGTFKLKHRASRAARNPQTGETIQTVARDEIGFKPTKPKN